MGEIKRNILKQSDDMLRHYEKFRYEDVAPIANPRMDYATYTTIKINKRDKDGDYVEIPIINADTYQRLWNPVFYMVLVKYVGSGRDYQAIGEIVRKDIIWEEVPPLKPAKDNNFEVL